MSFGILQKKKKTLFEVTTVTCTYVRTFDNYDMKVTQNFKFRSKLEQNGHHIMLLKIYSICYDYFHEKLTRELHKVLNSRRLRIVYKVTFSLNFTKLHAIKTSPLDGGE
jgi:hypothetical protein